MISRPASTETVLVERRSGAALVTLNRPSMLNALNADLIRHLSEVFDGLGRDANIRGVVLTGAGDRAFAAGADIGELSEASGIAARAASFRGQMLLNRIESLGKPVIAAVNGAALGGGCELAMACTLRIAAVGAQFGLPEVKLGLIPGFGGTVRLPRLIGHGRAMKMILAGDPIGAEEALAAGLVSEIVSSASLIERCFEVLGRILRNGPIAIRHAIEALTRADGVSPPAGFALESALFGLCASTDDMREGTRAFLDRRKPAFTGR